MSITGSVDVGNGLLAVTVDHDPTSVATDVPAGSLIVEESTAIWYKKLDNGSTTNVLVAAGDFKELFFRPINAATAVGQHTALQISSNGNGVMNFEVPADFHSLTMLDALFVPAAGAAGSGKDIDLSSDYGTIDEGPANHSETDTGTTYDFTGRTGLFTALDLSPVFSSLDAGDVCGIQINHNSIGGAMDYYGIRMRYE